MTKKRSVADALMLYVPMILMLIFIVVPFLWTILLSLKDNSEIVSGTAGIWPEHLTLRNYIDTWQRQNFSVYFKNSLWTAFVSLIFITFFSILNGYALSRFRFRGKKAFMTMLIGTQIMPIILLIIPLYVIFSKVGLINNSWSLIIFYTARQLPFNSIMMQGFISGIPITLEEAAWVDGCGRLRTMFRILLPQLVPGIIATGVFAFVSSWNEFMIPFSFLTNESLFPLPVALKYMIGEYSVDYGSLAAGSVIALVLPVAMFAYIQKYLISGLSSGSVKG